MLFSFCVNTALANVTLLTLCVSREGSPGSGMKSEGVTGKAKFRRGVLGMVAGRPVNTTVALLRKSKVCLLPLEHGISEACS